MSVTTAGTPSARASASVSITSPTGSGSRATVATPSPSASSTATTDTPAAPEAWQAPRERGDFGDAVWFALSVGHTGRAEARWLLPKICEAGGITRDAIGAIRVRQDETFVQIATASAGRFGPEVELEPGLSMRRLSGEPNLERPEQGAERGRPFRGGPKPAGRPAAGKPARARRSAGMDEQDGFADRGTSGARTAEAGGRKPKPAGKTASAPWDGAPREPRAPRTGNAPGKAPAGAPRAKFKPKGAAGSHKPAKPGKR